MQFLHSFKVFFLLFEETSNISFQGTNIFSNHFLAIEQTNPWVNPWVYTPLSDCEDWAAKVRKPRQKWRFTDQ